MPPVEETFSGLAVSSLADSIAYVCRTNGEGGMARLSRTSTFVHSSVRNWTQRHSSPREACGTTLCMSR
jgi:hypothetical protein